MSRQSQEEVAAAAQRRLELLRRELERSGLPRLDDEAVAWSGASDLDDLPPATSISRAGRHARTGGVRRVAGWFGDQVPETLRGRVRLGRGPALLVAGLVVLALAVTTWAVLRTSGSSAAAPAPPARSAPLVPLASPGTSASPSALGSPGAVTTSSSGATSTVTVDVAGRSPCPG